MRLVGRPIEVYNYLEPLYNDYRKLRLLNQDGSYSLSYLDEVVDQMLHQDYLFDIALPRLPQRYACPSAPTSPGPRLTSLAPTSATSLDSCIPVARLCL